MSVRIYVEGGGDQQNTLALCRSGFSRLFAKIVREGHLPKVIACGSRNDAFADFCTALKVHSSDIVVLLVDSEDELSAKDCWTYLMDRDGWQRPTAATEDSIYLMVRCMESWFLADKDALRRFYGQKLLVNSLPKSPNVEIIIKGDIETALDHATKPTGRKYHKTQHGFDILASLDPVKVAAASIQAKRLMTFLRSL